MLLTPLKFCTLSEAIEEAQRWDEELEISAVVTKEDDGSYTLFGLGEKVWNCHKVLLVDTEPLVNQQT